MTLHEATDIAIIASRGYLPKQLDVFAVQPHMHTLGTKITFERGASEATAQTIYARDRWVFGVQPIDTLQMTLDAGDYVATTCTYDNTTSQEVKYGESTKDEMCYFILFCTPFDKLGGCVQ